MTQRKRKLAIDVFKSINGLKLINNNNYERIAHTIGTRGNNNTLRIPKCKTEAMKRSTAYQGAAVFNELPVDIRSEESVIKFQKIVNNFNF